MDLEDRLVAEIERVNALAAPSEPGRAKRAQHPKHHGCIIATFEVREDIPTDLQQGLFAKPGHYPAFIRFSNGRHQDDRCSDAHGMAIKLLEVEGAKLIEDQRHQSAQDFILVDSEVFFTGRGDEYGWLNRGLLQPNQGWFSRIGFGLLLLWRFPLLLRILRFTSRRPTSPLTQAYYSTTPYALGTKVVKWVACPASARTDEPLATEDGLGLALCHDLAVEPFTFEFGVDVQTDPASQPIEDPTKAWSTVIGARRHWLARIQILPQVVNSAAPLAEDIAYSPWHGLQAHEPLGLINRLRRPVYRSLAVRRHALNGVTPLDTSELPDEPRAGEAGAA